MAKARVEPQNNHTPTEHLPDDYSRRMDIYLIPLGTIHQIIQQNSSLRKVAKHLMVREETLQRFFGSIVFPDNREALTFREWKQFTSDDAVKIFGEDYCKPATTRKIALESVRDELVKRRILKARNISEAAGFFSTCARPLKNFLAYKFCNNDVKSFDFNLLQEQLARENSLINDKEPGIFLHNGINKKPIKSKAKSRANNLHLKTLEIIHQIILKSSSAYDAAQHFLVTESTLQRFLASIVFPDNKEALTFQEWQQYTPEDAIQIFGEGYYKNARTLIIPLEDVPEEIVKNRILKAGTLSEAAGYFSVINSTLQRFLTKTFFNGNSKSFNFQELKDRLILLKTAHNPEENEFPIITAQNIDGAHNVELNLPSLLLTDEEQVTLLPERVEVDSSLSDFPELILNSAGNIDTSLPDHLLLTAEEELALFAPEITAEIFPESIQQDSDNAFFTGNKRKNDMLYEDVFPNPKKKKLSCKNWYGFFSPKADIRSETPCSGKQYDFPKLK